MMPPDPPPVPLNEAAKLEITEEIYKIAKRNNAIRWVITVGSSPVIFVLLWRLVIQGWLPCIVLTSGIAFGIFGLLTKKLRYADLPSTAKYKKYERMRK